MPVARLTSSRDIRAVFGSRQRAGSALLVVHASSHGDEDTSAGATRLAGPDARVAVVAGRAVGNAVHRNRAKRRLRGALRDVTLPHGLDLVVTAKPGLSDAPYPTLRDDLQSALTRVARKVRAA